MPAFGQVLLEVAEGAQTQLPPDVRRVLLLDQEDLPQSLDFLLHLRSITPVKPDSTIFASLPRCDEPRHLRQFGPQVVHLLVAQLGGRTPVWCSPGGEADGR